MLWPVARTERVLLRWRGRNRQQRFRARDEARDLKSEKQPFRRQRARRSNGSHPGQPNFDLSAARTSIPSSISHSCWLTCRSRPTATFPLGCPTNGNSIRRQGSPTCNITPLSLRKTCGPRNAHDGRNRKRNCTKSINHVSSDRQKRIFQQLTVTQADTITNTTKFGELPCAYLINVLNEVLYGFRVDYAQTLETLQSEIVKLFQKLNALCQGNVFDPEMLSVAEAQLLLKCSKLCLTEIDTQEFSTRLGESTKTALNINEQLSQYIKGS